MITIENIIELTNIGYKLEIEKKKIFFEAKENSNPPEKTICLFFNGLFSILEDKEIKHEYKIEYCDSLLGMLDYLLVSKTLARNELNPWFKILDKQIIELKNQN